MSCYRRRVRFRLSQLTTAEEELATELERLALRLEGISLEGHDVVLDLSVDAESAEAADAQALVAARLIPAWRVVIVRLDSPGVVGARVERGRRDRLGTTIA
jgi:hypothetical protein